MSSPEAVTEHIIFSVEPKGAVEQDDGSVLAYFFLVMMCSETFNVRIQISKEDVVAGKLDGYLRRGEKIIFHGIGSQVRIELPDRQK